MGAGRTARPAVMRVPGRIRVSWENDTTLRIDTDAGLQTRRLRFGAAAPDAGDPHLAGAFRSRSGSRSSSPEGWA